MTADIAALETAITDIFDNIQSVTPETKGETREYVQTALNLLDSGELRVAEKVGADWVVHQWLKKAVLINFRLNEMTAISGGPGGS